MNPKRQKVINAAKAQVGVTRFYDPAYSDMAYPNGDVPMVKGVCSDVIIRAFRAGGVDLQKAVHEDMKAHFGAYPKLWNLRRTDANIDHRRVANLMRFFERKRVSLPVSRKPADYHAGDIVAWRLPGGRLHIGLISDMSAGVPNKAAPLLVVHNIGAGAQNENVLFAWPLIGHYRWPF